MSENKPKVKKFDFKKALLFGITPALIIQIFNSITKAIIENQNPFSNKIAGPNPIVYFFLGIGVAYIFQTKKKIWGWLSISLLSILVVFVSISMVINTNRLINNLPPPKLNLKEMAEPIKIVKKGTTYLYHPGLGFSFLDPGQDYEKVPDHVIVSTGGKRPEQGITGFYYTKVGVPPASFGIGVIKHNKISKKKFQETTEGLKKGMLEGIQKYLDAPVKIQIITEKLEWTKKKKEFHFHLLINKQVHRVTHAWYYSKSYGRVYIIVLTGTNIAIENFRRIIQSFEIER